MMNRIFLLLFWAFVLVSPIAAANPYDDPAIQAADEIAYDSSLRRVLETQVQEVEAVNAGYKETWENNRKGKLTKDKKYFQDITMTSCEEPADLVCPPLTTEAEAEGFRTRLNSINLQSGELSCSILPPVFRLDDLSRKTETSVVFKQVFVNNACVEKYSTASNVDNSESIQKLIEENSEFTEELKQQQLKYLVDYKSSGEQQYLDVADVLDSIVSFSPEVFLLEETLLTRDLKTRAGYTIKPNDTVIEQFTQKFKHFSEIWDGDGFSSDRFYQQAEIQASIKNASSAVANSSFYLLLDFWLKSNEIFIDISLALALVFVSFSVLTTWVVPGASAKMMNLQYQRENHLQRAFSGVLLATLLFANDVEKLNVEYQSEEGVIKSQLIVQQTKINSMISLLYTETNYWADQVNMLATQSFINNLTSRAGLFDEAQINALASERLVLNKKMEQLKEIDTKMCFENYDVKAGVDLLKAYRTKHLDKNAENTEVYSVGLRGVADNVNIHSGMLQGDSSISSLKANAYPKSEREAHAMINTSPSGNKTPYNSTADISNSGIVDKTAVDKFRVSDYSPLSLSGCFYNKKTMIESESRLREIEAQFEKMEDPTVKNAKVEYLKLISEIMYSSMAEFGYLSISFLPATSMFIDNIGILDEVDDLATEIDEADSEDALTNLATNSIKRISEDIPILTMLGGYQVAKIIHPVKNAIIDSTLKKIGNITSAASFGAGRLAVKTIKNLGKIRSVLKVDKETDVLDLMLAAMIIKSIFKALIITALVVGSIFIFLLLFIEKLLAFTGSLFLIIHVFSKNQEQHFANAAGKIIVVALKTILIVVCVFLGMWVLSIANFFEAIFVEKFFKSMDAIENQSWAMQLTDFNFDSIIALIQIFFQKYIFYGVAKLSFLIMYMVLAVAIIWKFPNYIVELVYQRMNSVADSVGETLESATKSSVAKI